MTMFLRGASGVMVEHISYIRSRTSETHLHRRIWRRQPTLSSSKYVLLTR